VLKYATGIPQNKQRNRVRFFVGWGEKICRIERFFEKKEMVLFSKSGDYFHFFSVFRIKKREKTIKAVEKSFFSCYFLKKYACVLKK
jgi:hypothetical protein